jgi:hypothetical protein
VVEALDGGDPKTEVPHRDRVFTLRSSEGFRTEHLVTKTVFRFSGLHCFENGLQLLVSESWWSTRRTVTRLLTMTSQEKQVTTTSQDETAAAAETSSSSYTSAVLFDRSYEDRYSDPGSPVEGMAHFGPHCHCPLVYNMPEIGGRCVRSSLSEGTLSPLHPHPLTLALTLPSSHPYPPTLSPSPSPSPSPSHPHSP